MKDIDLARAPTTLSDQHNTLERLLHFFPEERERLRPYIASAKAYRNECGCWMGGVFLVVALGLLVLYGLFNGFGSGNLLIGTLEGTSFVFAAGIVGKLTGIGIARIRLALLYRHLRIKYEVEGG